MTRILCKVYILLAIFYTFNIANAQMCINQKGPDNNSGKLNVLIKMHAPFISFNQKSNSLDGIDVRILRMFADRMKLDIAFEMIDDTNDTTALNLKKYHLIAGFLTLPQTAEFISSVPYIQDDITWCVRQAEPVPRWRRVFLIVKDVKVYIVSSILATFSVVLMYFLTSLDGQPMDIWKCTIFALVTTLGMSAPVEVKTSKVRFFFVLVLIEQMIIYTTVVAFSTMIVVTTIYSKQINTIDGLIDANFNLTGDARVLSHLMHGNLLDKHSIPEHQLQQFEVCNDIEKCLEKLTFDLTLAVAVSRHHLKTLPIHKNIYSFDLSQNIYDYLRTISINSNYTMGKEFNAFLERIIESGLITKWQKEFEFEPIPQRELLEIQSVDMKDGGMISVCVILILFAMIVRYVEQVIYRKAHAENAHAFWRWASAMIDGDPHFFPFTRNVHECIYHRRSLRSQLE